MNPWKLLKDRIVIERKADEAFHAAALDELQSGKRRPGLMAKAMAESGGNEQHAKVAYFRLLVTAIKDDYYLARRATEAQAQVQPKPRQQPEHRAPEADLTRDRKTGLLKKPHIDSIDWIPFVVTLAIVLLFFLFASGASN